MTGATIFLECELEQVVETSADNGLLIGKVVGGIDYYLIGIALLIFGYGIYELVISDIDPENAASKIRAVLEE